MPIDWIPDGWRRKMARQQPVYADAAVVEAVTQRLQRLPALADIARTRRLRSELAAAAAEEAFVLQGGNCAENFADFAYGRIADTHALLREMALIYEPLYTVHEALLLPYEEALLRRAEDTGQWHGGSGHFLWIGERTCQLNGAHVELLRGLSNPIGIKLGPSTKPEELVQLTRVLNPENAPGRLTLIARMGAGAVEDRLPPLIEAVQAAGRTVLWLCDPMHGNTTKAAGGFKTRHLDTMIAELRGYVRAKTYPGDCIWSSSPKRSPNAWAAASSWGRGSAPGLPQSVRSTAQRSTGARAGRADGSVAAPAAVGPPGGVWRSWLWRAGTDRPFGQGRR